MQHKLLQHKDHPCKPLPKIPTSLAGSQSTPPQFSQPKPRAQQSTPAINLEALPAFSENWQHCSWGMMYGEVTNSPFARAHPFPLLQAFFIGFSDWTVKHLPAIPRDDSGPAAAFPLGRQRVVSGRCLWEGGGGRRELGIINGTIEWVMPLWFQLTSELCSDKISWLPTNSSKTQML